MWKMKTTDVDHGYSWVILIFCGINYMLVIGGVKSFGVLYTELLDYYDAGAGNTAWIPSLCTFMLLALGPISNFLGERYTYRFVMTTGGCLILIGFTASAFVPRIEVLYLTIGILVGTGYGFVFAPCTTIISFYFKKRRSLANGLMVSFSGFGTTGFPYMYRFLIDTYGLHGAFMIIGAVSFHVSAASMFLRQPIQFSDEKEKRPEESTFITHNKIKQEGFLKVAKKRIFKLDLFRISKYTIYFIALFLQAANFAGNNITLSGQVRSLNLGKQTITLCVSVVGATEIVARAFLGWFADLNIISRRNLLVICTLISGTSAFIVPFVPYKETMIGYSVIVGVFCGSFWSIMGVLIVDSVGLNNFPPAFGLLSLACSVTIGLIQPTVGWLEDVTGNWDLSFYCLGLLSLVAFLLFLTEPCFEHCWCCNNDSKSRQDNITLSVKESNQVIEKDKLLID